MIYFICFGGDLVSRIIYHQRGMDQFYRVWHTSNVNLIIYMHSSGGRIVCSEKTLPINKGAMCFIGSGKYHYTMPDNIEGYERSKLFFVNEELNSIFSVLHNGEQLKKKFASESIVYAQIEEDEQQTVEKMITDVYNHRDDKNFDAVFFSTIMRFLTYIDENQKDKISSPAGMLVSAIEYINSHVSENIKIDDVCDAVHLSKYHFCREFKRMTGQTLMQYVLNTRIVLAKNMLLKEKYSIREISEKCGFSSMSYFCRMFKKESGLTPMEFKRHGEKA